MNLSRLTVSRSDLKVMSRFIIQSNFPGHKNKVTAKTCRHAPMSVQCFIHLKSQFQEKNPVLPNTEISVSCAIQERDNIRITTPHYPVFLLSVKWSLTGGQKQKKISSF